MVCASKMKDFRESQSQLVLKIGTSKLQEIFYYSTAAWCALTVNTFVPNAPFIYPLKTSGSLMFSGGRERVHWEQMD